MHWVVRPDVNGVVAGKSRRVSRAKRDVSPIAKTNPRQDQSGVERSAGVDAGIQQACTGNAADATA
jgi:hypothetical protein